MHFAGHTHRDQLTVFNLENIPPVLITPALTPVYDNSPSFRVFEQGSDFRIVTYKQLYMDLYSANKAELSMSTS